MFYGVQISSGLSDWQVLQRHEGVARVVLAGRWRLEAGAVRAGVQSVTPVLRVVSEQDQSLILPWTACDSRTEDGVNGEWEITATLPQGGPYRVETSLEAVSSQNGDHWMFRGDIRVHVGVGDLFCMAGQSNAAGYAKGEAFDPPDPRVRLLRNSGRWDMAAHPMNDATDAADCVNAPMGITGTSPFLSFGRRYADAAAVPVGLIQAAQGGSPMARWDMRRCGDLLRSMLDRMDACGGVCAILWYQGCADASPADAAIYGESFARMVRAVRAHAGFDVPFFTMQLNKYFAQEDAFSWAAVKEAQRQAALGLENVFLLPTALLSMSDEVHNSARGNVALGEMLAKQVYAALCGGRAYAAPALESVGMRDGCVCLRFTAFGTLTRLNATADRKDFMLSDARGEVEVETVRVSGREITLSSARPLEGKMLVSYGARPEGPVAPIVDEFTYLPIISFYNAEVS